MKVENENLVAKYNALDAQFKELTTSYGHFERNFDAISNELNEKPKVEVKIVEKIVEKVVENPQWTTIKRLIPQ